MNRPDHVAEALAQLPIRDRKPNIEAFLTLLATRSQEMSDVWFQLYTELSIENGVGAQLDQVGGIVNEVRGGKSDTDYKLYLSSRVAANNSNGTYEDLLRVVRGVVNDPELRLRMEPSPPKGLILHAEGKAVTAEVAEAAISFLKDARQGGVTVQFHYHTADPDNVLAVGAMAYIDAVGPFTVPIGTTTLNLTRTSGFPASGSVVIDPYGTPETVTYTSKNDSQLLGVSPTTIAHSWADIVKLPNSTTKGFSGNAAPTLGGRISGVLG